MLDGSKVTGSECSQGPRQERSLDHEDPPCSNDRGAQEPCRVPILKNDVAQAGSLQPGSAARDHDENDVGALVVRRGGHDTCWTALDVSPIRVWEGRKDFRRAPRRPYARSLVGNDALLRIEPPVGKRDLEVGIVATGVFECELECRPSCRRQLSWSLALSAAVLSRACVGDAKEALREGETMEERLELVELLLRDLLRCAPISVEALQKDHAVTIASVLL